MEVRAVFDNPNGVIKPGQFLKARVLGAVRPNAIIVPQTAVMQGSKSMYVYLIKGDQAVVTDIEVGEWFGNYWIVTGGLMAGDQVVSNGISKLQSGSKVAVTGTEKYVPPTSHEQLTPMKNYGI
jgi:membrane fusion protein (multidrug efflux system)